MLVNPVFLAVLLNVFLGRSNLPIESRLNSGGFNVGLKVLCFGISISCRIWGRNRFYRSGFVLKDANRYPLGVVGRKAASAGAAQKADAMAVVAQDGNQTRRRRLSHSAFHSPFGGTFNLDTDFLTSITPLGMPHFSLLGFSCFSDLVHFLVWLSASRCSMALSTAMHLVVGGGSGRDCPSPEQSLLRPCT